MLCSLYTLDFAYEDGIGAEVRSGEDLRMIEVSCNLPLELRYVGSHVTFGTMLLTHRMQMFCR